MKLTILILLLQSKTKAENLAELILFPFTSVHSLKEFKTDSAKIHSFYTYYLLQIHTQNIFEICIKN